jgi:hypothetical protein
MKRKRERNKRLKKSVFLKEKNVAAKDKRYYDAVASMDKDIRKDYADDARNNANDNKVLKKKIWDLYVKARFATTRKK